MKIHIDHTIYTGRPDPATRLEKENRTYDVLEKLGIPFTRLDHEEAKTIEDCNEVDQLLKITICKNLFLCNTQKTKFYLLMLPGEKKFQTKDLSAQIGSARLSFAPSQYLEEFLDITPGSVSIMGLMNDTGNKVQLLIDKDVLKDEFIGCHPCINTSSIRIKAIDIMDKFLPYVNHEPILVDI
ncbi:MAG TPA: prolyl-tRNA synthetase associated domain-containing protein [Mobilitalea sp.]|nr:prolyl-tRNA synthetase associated domain-containing protein [Mobilitalea sp.]